MGNIGQVNRGCYFPGACSIIGSTVYGRKKREDEGARSKRSQNHFAGPVGQVNTFQDAGQVNIGAPGPVGWTPAVATGPVWPYPATPHPGYPAQPYPSYPTPAVNSFAGANIGAVNQGCSSGSCNIVGSHVSGK